MNNVAVRTVPAKSVVTKSNLPVCDFSVNPYVGCSHACRYCYASFMKRFTGHDEPWGKFVDAKEWPSIKHSSKLNGKELFIGSVCDPYMPKEATLRRTRTLLEQLRGSGAIISIQTKSNLVLRDLDLIAEFPNARVGFSINTLDENFRSNMDNAVSIEQRIKAMEAVHAAGIRTTCFISPIFPGITDVPAIVERVRDICNLVWLENLNLRGSFKADIMGYIAHNHPDLAPLYETIYSKKDNSYWENLDTELRTYAVNAGLGYAVNDDALVRSFDEPPMLVNFFYHEKIKKSAAKR